MSSLRISVSSCPPTSHGPAQEERGDRAAMEEPTLDGSTLDDRPLGIREAVDAGGEQRLQRRRHLQVRSILGERRDELFDEQRIALGGLHDPLDRLGHHLPEVAHELGAVGRG